jgi:hypothetical protein
MRSWCAASGARSTFEEHRAQLGRHDVVVAAQWHGVVMQATFVQAFGCFETRLSMTSFDQVGGDWSETHIYLH